MDSSTQQQAFVKGKKKARGPGKLDPKVREALETIAVVHILHQQDCEFIDPTQLCWSLEQAHWSYKDEMRAADPTLPTYKFPQFVSLLVDEIPGLEGILGEHPDILTTFSARKSVMPVYGAILLNKAMDKVLLVRSFGSKGNWSWPRGKLEKQDKEDCFACASREVYEETSFDIDLLGVNSTDCYIERHIHGKTMGLFVVVGVDEGFHFSPKCKGEIESYAWFPVNRLPRTRDHEKDHQNADSSRLHYHAVYQFTQGLLQWIDTQKRKQPRQKPPKAQRQASYSTSGIVAPPWGDDADFDSPVDFEALVKKNAELCKQDATRVYDGVRPAYQVAAMREPVASAPCTTLPSPLTTEEAPKTEVKLKSKKVSPACVGSIDVNLEGCTGTSVFGSPALKSLKPTQPLEGWGSSVAKTTNSLLDFRVDTTRIDLALTRLVS